MGWLTELIQQSKTQDRTKNVLKCIESMNPKKKNYLGNLVASFSRDLVNVNKSDWRVFLQREINCDGVTTPMVLKGLAAVSEAWETVNEADVELWFLQDNKTGRVELFVSFFSLSLLLSTSSCFFLVMSVTWLIVIVVIDAVIVDWRWTFGILCKSLLTRFAGSRHCTRSEARNWNAPLDCGIWYRSSSTSTICTVIIFLSHLLLFFVIVIVVCHYRYHFDCRCNLSPSLSLQLRFPTVIVIVIVVVRLSNSKKKIRKNAEWNPTQDTYPLFHYFEHDICAAVSGVTMRSTILQRAAEVNQQGKDHTTARIQTIIKDWSSESADLESSEDDWAEWLKKLESEPCKGLAMSRWGSIFRACLRINLLVQRGTMGDRDNHPIGYLIGQNKYMTDQNQSDVTVYIRNLIDYYVAKHPACGMVWFFVCFFLNINFLIFVFILIIIFVQIHIRHRHRHHHHHWF